jgi:hypothetical protein
MRGITRAMMWSLVALICFAVRPVAGGPQGASGVQVDKNSIGGVVLNSRSARSWLPTIKADSSFPICRMGRMNFGCAATG